MIASGLPLGIKKDIAKAAATATAEDSTNRQVLMRLKIKIITCINSTIFNHPASAVVIGTVLREVGLRPQGATPHRPVPARSSTTA